MSVDDIFLFTANTFLFAAAALALIFLVLYQLLATWEDTAWGWNVVGSTLFLFLVLTLGVGAAIFGVDFPGRQAVRTVIFLGAAVFLVHHIYLLLKVQFRGKWRPFVADVKNNLSNLRHFFESKKKKSTPPDKKEES
jgi:hypothetical protein